MRKIIAAFFFALLLGTSSVGCANSTINESHTELPSKIQLGDDIFVEPVPAPVAGDELSDTEIDALARKLFIGASELYYLFSYSADSLQLVKDDSVEKEGHTWKKVKYIDTWKQFEAICNSFYSKEQDLLPTAEKRMLEHNGFLYQSNELVGGSGGTWYIKPTSKKIQVLSKKPDEIDVRVNVLDGIALCYNDLWRDGDKDYTLLRQNGYWVLRDFQGSDAEENIRVDAGDESDVTTGTGIPLKDGIVYVEPVMAEVAGDKLSDDEIASLTQRLFAEASIVYQDMYLRLEEIDVNKNKSIEKDSNTWYNTIS